MRSKPNHPFVHVWSKVFINQVRWKTSIWNSYLIKFYVQGLSEFWLSICYIAAGYFKLAYSCFKLADSCWFETWNSTQIQRFLVHSLKFTQPLDIWESSYLEISCTKQILDSLYLFYNALVQSNKLTFSLKSSPAPSGR